MNKTMMMLMTIIILISMMSIMISMISKKMKINHEKMSSFECGFNPMSKKRLPFSIHFFLLAVIFLIFDIEVIIILPMIMSMKFSKLSFWLFSSFFFVMILIMGLYNEWYNGLLNWTQ